MFIDTIRTRLLSTESGTNSMVEKVARTKEDIGKVKKFFLVQLLPPEMLHP